ncbi:MAG: VOC family protein [Ancalomicrobiaceae bacterium]|nr:VOC family protein [Ancalomicrobiaceae bacterium]
MAESNDFIWYELMTSDVGAAVAFYGRVVGWTAADSGAPGMRYSIFSAGARMVAGLMQIPAEVAAGGGRPFWAPYVWVADVDAHAAKLTAAGGQVCRPPEDIPGVGRFAVVADPDGTVFHLFRPASDQAPERAAPGTPGLIDWHELHAGNGDVAWAFYSSLFGWEKERDMAMGEMGVYRIFKTADRPVGGMMTKMPQSPVPFWLLYFAVEAIDAAKDRVIAAGGTILNGPMEVPGGSWIVQCLDPQGAVFGLVAQRQ